MGQGKENKLSQKKTEINFNGAYVELLIVCAHWGHVFSYHKYIKFGGGGNKRMDYQQTNKQPKSQISNM